LQKKNKKIADLQLPIANWRGLVASVEDVEGVDGRRSKVAISNRRLEMS